MTRLGDFGKFLAKKFLQKKPNLLNLKLLRLLSGHLLNKLGNFLFQHVVKLTDTIEPTTVTLNTHRRLAVIYDKNSFMVLAPEHREQPSQ